MMIVVLVFLLVCSSQAQRQLDDVCLSLRRPLNDDSSVVTQGAPGKRGVKGEIGFPGPKGSRGDTGQCTCNPSQFTQLNEQISSIASQFERQRLLLECVKAEGFIYEDLCISLAYTQGVGITFPEARTICQEKGQSLADVADDRTYDAIFHYAKRAWIVYTDRRDWVYLQIWLGSTYQVNNNPRQLITLSTGRKTTSARWHLGYPSSDMTFVNMAIQIKLRGEDGSTGLYNYRASYEEGVPLCQFSLTP